MIIEVVISLSTSHQVTMYRVQLSKLFSFLLVESVSSVAQVKTSTFTTSFATLKVVLAPVRSARR